MYFAIKGAFCRSKWWCGLGPSERWDGSSRHRLYTIHVVVYGQRCLSMDETSVQNVVEYKRNLVAHGNARVEKWRGKRRMEGVASRLALYRTWSIQHYYCRCAYFGCQQPTELIPPPIKMDSSISLKDQIWFLRVCHHILFSTWWTKQRRWIRRGGTVVCPAMSPGLKNLSESFLWY